MMESVGLLVDLRPGGGGRQGPRLGGGERLGGGALGERLDVEGRVGPVID
jgi:hypothetical protein